MSNVFSGLLKVAKMQKLSESVFQKVKQHYEKFPSDEIVVNLQLNSLSPENIMRQYNNEIENIVNTNYQFQNKDMYMQKLAEAVIKDIDDGNINMVD